MTTRRQFLQGSLATAGLATAAGALTGGPGLAAMLGPGGTRLRLETVLFEPSRTHSASFASAAVRLGLPTLGIGHDITPVWQQLLQLWRTAPRAIGGLTSLTPLLLLEQSARDHGLRVVFRSEHHPDGRGTVTHSLQGAEDILHAFDAGVAHGADYGACMAHAMVRCPANGGRPGTVRLQSTTTANRRADAASLHAWVMAPRPAFKQGSTT
ncbi:hypothetical protein [Luteimonas sp. A478]